MLTQNVKTPRGPWHVELVLAVGLPLSTVYVLTIILVGTLKALWALPALVKDERKLL